ncbi:MAG: hypothetical protein ACKE5M_02780 [Methylophilaceae bacterium]
MTPPFNEGEILEPIDSEQYGIEIKEVSFEMFERRKAPRTTDYKSFVKSMASSTIESDVSEEFLLGFT